MQGLSQAPRGRLSVKAQNVHLEASRPSTRSERILWPTQLSAIGGQWACRIELLLLRQSSSML